MKSVTIWIMVVVLCLANSQAMALIEFKDGGNYVINYEINDDIRVDYEAPGMETTVNLLAGGNIIYPYDLRGYNDSRINISGGTSRSSLEVYDNSQVNLSGGWIGYYLRAYDNSQVDLSDGEIGFYLCAYDNSQINISGGLVENRLNAYGSSQVNFSGGLIGGHLCAFENSQVEISGGSIEGELRVEGILTILGSDFAVDGQQLGYGELFSIFGGSHFNEPDRHLTGMLASGQLIDNNFHIGRDGSIVLAVPEPATLFLLGFGAVVLRKKR